MAERRRVARNTSVSITVSTLITPSGIIVHPPLSISLSRLVAGAALPGGGMKAEPALGVADLGCAVAGAGGTAPRSSSAVTACDLVVAGRGASAGRFSWDHSELTP